MNTGEKTFQCEVVSAEKQIFSGEVTFLSVDGTQGQLGILKGHAPLLSGIKPGVLTLHFPDGSQDHLYLSGGYLEVQPQIVTILADTAIRAHDVDEAAARRAVEKSQQELAKGLSDIDYAQVSARLSQAMAQLRLLEEIKRSRR